MNSPTGTRRIASFGSRTISIGKIGVDIELGVCDSGTVVGTICVVEGMGMRLGVWVGTVGSIGIIGVEIGPQPPIRPVAQRENIINNNDRVIFYSAFSPF